MLRRLCRVPAPSASASSITSFPLAAPTVSASAVSQADTAAAAKKPPFHYSDLGLNDANWQALYAAFSDKNKKRSDSFLPAMSIFHQCRYTVGVYRQLTRHMRQGRVERWLPAACLVGSGSAAQQQASTSRFIIATAFEEYRQDGNNSGGGKRLAPTEQVRQREQLQLVRRLAVEHFNWSYYWRSLTFEEETGGDKAQAAFAALAEPHSSFFSESSSSSKNNNKKKNASEDEVVARIKAALREHALQGGAASLGGSWTWLVWNPVSGTDFSTTNRYGVAGGVSSIVDGGKKATTSGDDEKKDAASAAATEGEQEKKSEDNTKDDNGIKVKIGGRLEVINTPFDVCPLDYGLFPILCINMTQRGCLASPAEWASVPVGETAYHNSTNGDDDASASAPPAWSRAARNAETIVTRTATLPTPGFQAFETIEKQRARFVDGILDGGRVNWGFAAQQLRRAVAWNESDAREEQLRGQAQAAWGAAEARLRRVLDRKVTDGDDEIDPDGVVNVDAAAAAQQEAAAAAEQQQDEQEQPAAAADETSSSSAPAEDDSSKAAAAATSSTSSEVLSSVAEDGSQVLEYPGGKKEYRYSDGRKTVTLPDGTTEWYGAPSASGDDNAIKLTRQRPDGKMEYFYNSGLVMEDIPLAGGTKGWRRVTTFTDGTKTEEALPARE